MLSLPDEKFDYILLLSALHYISEPAKLLQALRRILTPQGVLILEIGVATWQAERSVGRALRSIDERFFPSLALLTNVWLRDYVVRCHGESVSQAGDPVSQGHYAWARIDGRTLTVNVLEVGDEGQGRWQVYERRLTGDGMELTYRRLDPSGALRIVSGKLKRR